jgi:hypothetical protein
MNTPSRYGVIEQAPSPSDYRVGAIQPEIKEVLSTGDWIEYAPVHEVQKLDRDTLACVTFSHLNSLECQLAFYKKKIDLSDAWVAKATKTDLQGGNAPFLVAEYIRRFGGAPSQSVWPNGTSYAEFYRELDDKIQPDPVFNDFHIVTRWAGPTPEHWEKDLKVAPITFCGNYIPDAGPFPWSKQSTSPEHQMLLVKLEKRSDGWVGTFVDHYSRQFKSWIQPQYFASLPIQIILIPKQSMTKLPNIKDNTLVQDSGQGRSGQVGLYVAGKILLDTQNQQDPVLRTFLVRTQGVGLTPEVWDAIPKFNIRNPSQPL